MTAPPRSVLSEQFTDRLLGRRLVSAVFTTYRFDPGFFEQEILPVFMDLPLSHVPVVRLVQLDDALRDSGGRLAVYYDAGGLSPEAEPARLDIRRIPVRHRTGIFHPKNVLALVEEAEPDDEGHHLQTLLVACLSANLTRAGWWENVEAGHVEEIGDGDRTRLRDDLLAFLGNLRKQPASGTDQSALESIQRFLSRSTDRRPLRSSGGQLHTHFFDGTGRFVDFLERVAGNRLQDTYLEIISPYFDHDSKRCPLGDLIEYARPREVRLFLPRGPQGEALCRPEFYESLRDGLGVVWASLPQDLLRRGSGADAGERAVHAKVYRFFTMKPRTEFLFVGSVNLTQAAHQRAGNLESGFLVETNPEGRLDFWMTPEKAPKRFAEKLSVEEEAGEVTCPLMLRFNWTTGQAEGYWTGVGPSPLLELDAAGARIGTIGPVPPGDWQLLEDVAAKALAEHLANTSLIGVSAAGADGRAVILVQEEGMSYKPSLLLNLSVTDILKYWALLTTEQRAAFLDSRASEFLQSTEGADLVVAYIKSVETETLFDRFAGIFHAFLCVEQAVGHAIEAGNDAAAAGRLFGRRYDSLGTLLDRITDSECRFDDIERYLVLLCARQMVAALRRQGSEFVESHRRDLNEIEARIAELQVARREALISVNDQDMAAFLTWYESRFIARAKPIETVP